MRAIALLSFEHLWSLTRSHALRGSHFTMAHNCPSPAPLTHACHFLLAMLCHWLLPASSQGSAHNQHVWTVFFVDTAKNALVFSIRIQYDSQYGAMIHHQSTCNRPAFAAEVGERSAQPSVGGVLAPCSA